MKKIIPEKLFDFKAFEKIFPTKIFVPLTDFDIELFLKRHETLVNIIYETDSSEASFIGDLEYCGKEDNHKLYKIHFGANKDDLIFAVDNDNLISRIAVSVNGNDSESLSGSAGMSVLILRNAGLSLEEFHEFNKLFMSDRNIIFHWCEEAHRIIFLNRFIEGDRLYLGFFAAIEGGANYGDKRFH